MIVSGNRKRDGKQPGHGAEPPNGAVDAPFSFGSKRYASKGPRRLFLPHKTSATFEPEVNGPDTLLRARARFV